MPGNIDTLRCPGFDHLVTDRIEAITETGVMTADGTHHQVDVIIYGTGYGTGFHANRFLWPMKIVGLDGIDLQTLWDA